MEARAEEQRKAKAKADTEWRKQQREREAKRAEEERAREKEVCLLCMTRWGQKCRLTAISSLSPARRALGQIPGRDAT